MSHRVFETLLSWSSWNFSIERGNDRTRRVKVAAAVDLSTARSSPILIATRRLCADEEAGIDARGSLAQVQQTSVGVSADGTILGQKASKRCAWAQAYTVLATQRRRAPRSAGLDEEPSFGQDNCAQERPLTFGSALCADAPWHEYECPERRGA